LLRTTERLVTVRDTVDAAHPVGNVCLPNVLQRSSRGLVNARVHWLLPPASDATKETPSRCDERPFLHPTDVAFDAEYRLDFPGYEICDVDQLPVLSGPSGLSVPTEAGFYYDDFSTQIDQMCPHAAPYGVVFSETARPPGGVIVAVAVDEMVDVNGDPDPGRICRPVADVSQVGKSCLPALEDYEQSQSVLETRSAACGGGPCLVYHLDGSVADDCVDRTATHTCLASAASCPAPKPCATAEDLASHASCTCRCAAPDPDAELCTCAKGFACVPVFAAGDPAIVGSYCVPETVTVQP
jgi:hypothetical protein